MRQTQAPHLRLVHTIRCEWDRLFLAIRIIQREFREQRAAKKLEYGHEWKRERQ